jgi:hypothetical protein
VVRHLQHRQKTQESSICSIYSLARWAHEGYKVEHIIEGYTVFGSKSISAEVPGGMYIGGFVVGGILYSYYVSWLQAMVCHTHQGNMPKICRQKLHPKIILITRYIRVLLYTQAHQR